MKKDFSTVRLCVLVSSRHITLPFSRLVQEVVAGGADCIQLREKGLGDAKLLEIAKICRDICRDRIFIVNDRPDIARLSCADGVHVGQGDLPGPAARRIVGPDALVGISTANAAELAAAEEAGADYVGVGSVFASPTKNARIGGLEYVRLTAEVARVPFLAIGGINLDNVARVVAAGARGVAVSSAVIASRDPRGAAEAIREAVVTAADET
ncbi:MAG: thiamine phosphate synthase [Planctomycetes bacterium]|nr:thiamine phosphate synthase [Planctomycetota bacterium]